MAVQFRDYYQVLGVTKNASEDEIKSAYSKQARKYHPDVNPGDQSAEETFKELNGAYEPKLDASINQGRVRPPRRERRTAIRLPLVRRHRSKCKVIKKTLSTLVGRCLRASERQEISSASRSG